jgi:hypothetical protein
VAAASCTSIETMLRNWSQSLLAPSYAQPAAASLRASVNTPCEVGHKRRGPYAKTTERALLKIESRLLVAATSLPAQCLTSNAQNLVVEGDAIVHSKGCNCKHSHCLKRYCECHAAGARCTQRCKCLNCQNTQRASQDAQGADAQHAVKELCVEPPPLPFAAEQKFIVEGDAIVHSKGCNCKHSHCLKRYCECHAAGARCTPRCKCLSCGNG